MAMINKPERNAYPIRRLVNWYFANYCMRKCFDKDARLRDHQQKLVTFACKNPNLTMSHRDFLDLFNDGMTICTLDDSFKRRSVGWKLFSILNDTPGYDSDAIVVKDGIVQTRSGQLPKARRCPTCRALGIPL